MFSLTMRPISSMHQALNIIPECYVDTNLVSTILGGIGVNHQKGCNNVTARMLDKYNDSFAVGIIDCDKRKPGYLDEFELLGQSSHLSIFKHPVKHHYIITVSPAAEGFILSAANEAGISMNNYGLPSDLNGLKRITKTIVSNKDSRLISLFRDLSISGGEFATLRTILEYLMNKCYNVNVDALKALI